MLSPIKAATYPRLRQGAGSRCDAATHGRTGTASAQTPTATRGKGSVLHGERQQHANDAEKSVPPRTKEGGGHKAHPLSDARRRVQTRDYLTPALCLACSICSSCAGESVMEGSPVPQA